MVRMANQCPWCGADDWGVEESTVFCVACGQIVVGAERDSRAVLRLPAPLVPCVHGERNPPAAGNGVGGTGD